MVDAFFSTVFIERFKIILTGILIYAIIYAILLVTKPFGNHSQINPLIALIAAIIVSFSGVVTYAITYAINWFVIIIFIIFLILTLLMFLGLKPQDMIGALKGKNTLYIVIAFVILFSVILIKSFFAVNNTFDTNNKNINQKNIDQYKVNTNYNDGFTTQNPIKKSTSFFDRIDSTLLTSVIFLIGIGVFIILVGR